MDNFIKAVADINSSINSVVWGIPMLVLIIATGIFITARTCLNACARQQSSQEPGRKFSCHLHAQAGICTLILNKEADTSNNA